MLTNHLKYQFSISYFRWQHRDGNVNIMEIESADVRFQDAMSWTQQVNDVTEVCLLLGITIMYLRETLEENINFKKDAEDYTNLFESDTQCVYPLVEIIL